MLDTIVESLESTGKTDKFCTKITADYHDLKITVKELGQIEFPISTKTAKDLIKQGKPAKFGWRDQTLYDPKVRSAWKIPKSRIKIEKRSWNRTLVPVLQKVQNQLDLPEDSQLSAELHDMLIYEAGHFFSGHQDSEKMDGMVGTLVVWLPSDFRGGSLVVDLHGEKKIFRPPRDPSKQLTCIAFYADCYHEVKKVTSGYRMALTYNLIVKNPSTTVSVDPNKKLIRGIKNYFETPQIEGIYSFMSDHPRWLVYLLDHEYTQKSLNWPQLKGSDRETAAQLRNAAEELGLDIHLALADIQEVWDAQQDYGFNYRYWNYYEDEDEDDPDPDEVITGDLLCDECKLHHWIDSDGKKTTLRDHNVFRGMICWTTASDELEPFKSEYEGWMGNYGNTVERWYHRAAIVLWKKDNQYASWFAIDPVKTVTKVKKLLKKDLPAGRDALQQILPQWSRQISRTEAAEVPKVLDLAATVAEQKLATELIQVFNLEVLCKATEPGLRKLFSIYGEVWGLDILRQLAPKKSAHQPPPLLRDLLCLVKGSLQHYPQIAAWMLAYQFSTLVKQDQENSRKASDRELAKQMKTRCREAKELLMAALEIGDRSVHLKAIEHLLAHPRIYSPEILSKLSRKVPFSWKGDVPKKWGHDKLFIEAKQRLEALIAAKRQEGDWSISEHVFCDCNDCQQLRSFLLSRDEQKYVWPLAKRRRQHIHNVIDRMGIPVTHNTQRVGSPHKLILNKTSALFTKAEARHRAAVDEIARLEKFAETYTDI